MQTWRRILMCVSAACLLIALGVVLGSTIGLTVESFVKQRIIMSQESMTSGRQSLQVHSEKSIQTKAFFYNWTNPQELLQEGKKPRFKLVGPYIFREHQSRQNVIFNANGTVSFRMTREFHFASDLTEASISDNITTINAVAAALSYYSKDWSPTALYPLSMLLSVNNQQPFWTHSTAELLFRGVENSFLRIIPALSSVLRETLGWMQKLNCTRSGMLNIDTGSTNISNVGQIHYDNYTRQAAGSVADAWPQNLSKDFPIKVYSWTLRRSVVLQYEKDTTVDGLMVRRYTSSTTGLFKKRKLQLSSTADSSNLTLHNVNYQLVMDAEPQTGILVRRMVKEEHTFLLHPNPVLRMFRKVPLLVVPVLRLESTSSLDPASIHTLRLCLWLESHGQLIGQVTYATGLLIMFGILVYSFKRIWLSRLRAGRHTSRQVQQDDFDLEPRHSFQDDTVDISYLR